LAKIAVELEQALAERALNGAAGGATARVLAEGDGWRVSDVLCTSDRRDQPFEELHDEVSIAIVAAGTFQYRSGHGSALMVPGSLLLGTPGQSFECAHAVGAGDRCVSFRFTPELFARLAADAGAPRGARIGFPALRLPPLRATSPIVARACAAVAAGSTEAPWEEWSIAVATQAVQLATGVAEPVSLPPDAETRVSRVVRAIERQPHAELPLARLADAANLSRFHFLRTFERLTGMTPHQYILRTRLRNAALELELDEAKVLDVALDCGFGDVSNFNRTFRAEFGVSPRSYRRQSSWAPMS
jgi:AraC-like DNA-binding protein